MFDDKYEIESAGIGEEAVYVLVNGESQKMEIPDDDCDTEAER